jgi:hypothetical protein
MSSTAVEAGVSPAITCSQPAQFSQSLLAAPSGGRILSELAMTAAPFLRLRERRDGASLRLPAVAGACRIGQP